MSASVNLLHGICNTHQIQSKPATDKRGELIAERSSKADAETITLRVTTGGIFSTLLNSIPSFFSFCCAFFVVKPTSLSSCSCISSSCHKSQTSCDRSPKPSTQKILGVPRVLGTQTLQGGKRASKLQKNKQNCTITTGYP